MKQSKKNRNGIRVFKIINLFLISIFVLSLHLISNEINYHNIAYWFGVEVSLYLMYDLVLYLILGLILIEIILILGFGDKIV